MSFLKILRSQIKRCSSLNLFGSRPVNRSTSLSSTSLHHYSQCNFTEFAKKTGDYCSLSAVDIQVMALTYQLEKEHVGVEHLHSVPQMKKVEKFSEKVPAAHLAIAGFYMPPHKNKHPIEEESGSVVTDDESDVEPGQEKEDVDGGIIVIEGSKLKGTYCSEIKQLEEIASVGRVPEMESNPETKVPEMEEVHSDVMQEVFLEKLQQAEMEETQAMRDLEEALRKSEIKEMPESESGIRPWATGTEEEEMGHKYGTDEDESEEDDDIWDDNVWITPENVEEAKRDLQGALEEDGSVKVACITGDFAMQNTIKQMGLHAIAADGRIIKQLRTYILRCYSCFKTTSKMELLFCPHCGNHTLRRAAVLLKPDGSQEVQISYRRPPTGRGKRFTLPKPQGGKHANNPLLCPDQRLPQQSATKLARAKNNPLDPDYTAGFSPFVMRDVTSRSAMLGIRSCHSDIKNWMRRNPNEVVKKGKKRR